MLFLKDRRQNGRKKKKAVASQRRWRLLTGTVAKVVPKPPGDDTTAAAGLLPRLAEAETPTVGHRAEPGASVTTREAEKKETST